MKISPEFLELVPLLQIRTHFCSTLSLYMVSQQNDMLPPMYTHSLAATSQNFQALKGLYGKLQSTIMIWDGKVCW